MKFLNYLDGIITIDAKCISEIKSRIAMARTAFIKKMIFTSKLD
jgi:hypothetical protein